MQKHIVTCAVREKVTAETEKNDTIGGLLTGDDRAVPQGRRVESVRGGLTVFSVTFERKSPPPILQVGP